MTIELKDRIGEDKFNQITELLGQKIISIIVVDLNGREINLGVSIKLSILFRQSNLNWQLNYVND